MSRNYTPEMEEALRASQPVTFERAVEIAAEFGKTPRSVISKVKSLGLDYVPRVVAPKRPEGKTKVALLAEIAAALKVEATALDGLEKATSRSLANLLKGL